MAFQLLIHSKQLPAVLPVGAAPFVVVVVVVSGSPVGQPEEQRWFRHTLGAEGGETQDDFLTLPLRWDGSRHLELRTLRGGSASAPEPDSVQRVKDYFVIVAKFKKQTNKKFKKKIKNNPLLQGKKKNKSCTKWV